MTVTRHGGSSVRARSGHALTTPIFAALACWKSRRFYSHGHRGWSRSREIFGACGSAAGGGYPVCGTAFGVRAGLRVELDGGGLPVTPTGLWDLSPFYSLAAGT